MKSPYKKTQVLVRMINGYLRIIIKTAYGKETIAQVCSAETNDLDLFFWGDTQVREIQDSIGLSPKERTLLIKGNTLGKYAPRSMVEYWVNKKKEATAVREASILRTDEVLRELHKLFLRERRMAKSNSKRVSSVIIPCMDGSTLLWLNVILGAKKEFLRGHDDPRRIDEWDTMTPWDLLDEPDHVKRGYEEAWAYITARDFLFDDNYLIDLGDPYDKNSKGINCADLLDNLIENCKGRKIDSSFVDPSISHLRASLSKKSGDPKFIKLYCKKE